jgi:hypothetical protein
MGTGRVDQYEIKLNVVGADVEKAMPVFGIDPDKGKDRQIWFGEVLTGDDGRGALPLLGRGVILRVRAKKSSGGDVTLKLRGPDGCLDVTAWRARTRGLDAKIEGDWAGRRLVSGSLDSDLDDAKRAELAHPDPAVTDLMSTAQQQLAAELLLPLTEVTLLGPVAAQKWDPNHDGDVAAELWVVDDLRFLEISVVTDDDPEKAQDQLRTRAAEGGLTIDQRETKTTTVLRHLAERA